MQFYEAYSRHCAVLQEKEQLRSLSVQHSSPTTGCIDFCSNDYLNFTNSPLLKEGAYEAMHEFGMGSTGARLLSGNYSLISRLEEQIAQDKGTATALILNSGYQANLSVIAALLDSRVLNCKALVFCDKLNHSSIYQGIKLAGAELIRYHHNDMQHLKALLKQYQEDSRPKFIFTETLYGMDGDVVPLADLVELAYTYSAFLYLDEAHATGVLGPKGYGLSTAVQMEHIPHLVMGTFSKAIGVFGAYIACTINLKQYLINRCSGFIYSTTLPPMVVGAVSKAWSLISTLTQERIYLLQLAHYCREQLIAAGFDIGNASTHIIPIILGSEKAALKAQESLASKQILVSAIRPPTVPPSSSRLRIALTLAHTEHDIQQLLEGLKSI